MVKLENVTLAYNKNNLLYDRLNLQLNPGNIYGLLGKNGSGKSTLLKLISGVLFPDSGSIMVLNHDNSKREKKMLQDVYLLTEDNIRNNIYGHEYLNVYSKLYPRFDLDKFVNIAKRWELDYTQKLSDLSEGMHKKFFIAFALSTNCRLLLLDEPTNGLDIPSKTVFKQLIASWLNDESTLIISTHQVYDSDGLVDPIIIIDQGKILLNQTLSNIENKITFGTNLTINNVQDVLYSMPTVGGTAYAIIRDSDYRSETKTDLELLFNAVIKNREMITRLFGAQNEL